MDFIELFNGVVTLAKPVSAKESYAKSLGDQLTDLDLDSLDTIMLAMYFGEIYGIEEDVMQEMQAVTVSASTGSQRPTTTSSPGWFTQHTRWPTKSSTPS